ncbi:MAG: FecR/PupR family sigma factor regulator [Pirellulaceae bacterium]|nr:FecR/PupR family sigma factor regulator [Pirellulaceae bacterium]
MNDNFWPELDEQSLEDWMAALSDGELDPAQRQDLLQYLEAHPQHWRTCALALWDGQLLSSSVGSSIAAVRYNEVVRTAIAEPTLLGQSNQLAISRHELGQSETNQAPPSASARRRWSGTWLTLTVTAALLLVSTWSGWWFGTTQANGKVDVLETELQLTRHYADVVTGTLLAEQSTFRSLAGVFPDRPCLIEIENTNDRVVYLADGPVPEDLLRGLVQLGQVRVQPYRPEIETPLWNSLRRPVVAIEVEKFSSVLLAQGDSL